MEDLKTKVVQFVKENKTYVIIGVVVIVALIALSGCGPDQWPDWAKDAFTDPD